MGLFQKTTLGLSTASVSRHLGSKGCRAQTNLAKDTRGCALVEYVSLVSMISFVVLVGVSYVGDQTHNVFNEAQWHIGGGTHGGAERLGRRGGRAGDEQDEK